MRRTLTLCRNGLATAAAVALLAACGEPAEEPAADAPTETPAAVDEPEATEPEATEPGTEAPEAGSEFCTQAADLQEELDAALSPDADPATFEEALQQAADSFGAVEAPAELEDDWTALAQGLQELADAYAALDPQDPESLTEFTERGTELQTELAAASANVETYLTEQCGLGGEATGTEPTGTAPTETAAPTS